MSRITMNEANTAEYTIMQFAKKAVSVIANNIVVPFEGAMEHTIGLPYKTIVELQKLEKAVECGFIDGLANHTTFACGYGLSVCYTYNGERPVYSRTYNTECGKIVPVRAMNIARAVYHAKTLLRNRPTPMKIHYCNPQLWELVAPHVDDKRKEFVPAPCRIPADEKEAFHVVRGATVSFSDLLMAQGLKASSGPKRIGDYDVFLFLS